MFNYFITYRPESFASVFHNKKFCYIFKILQLIRSGQPVTNIWVSCKMALYVGCTRTAYLSVCRIGNASYLDHSGIYCEFLKNS